MEDQKKESKKIEDSFSYKVGWLLGTLIQKILILMWKGVVVACCKSNAVIIVYGCLAVCTFTSFLLFDNISVMLTIIIITSIACGIWVYYDEKPLNDKIKYFYALFDTIDLRASDDQLPRYLYEKDISEYARDIAFYTVVPLNIWQTKKDLLEMYMNIKLIAIRQDSNDNRHIHIIIELEPLPTYLTFEKEYVNTTKPVINIGMGYYGMVGLDLKKHPHCFIAGETGSGKSNILKCMIYQAIQKNYDVILIDFKRGVSFSTFNEAVKIYSEYSDTVKVLESLVDETKQRLDLIRDFCVDNIDDFNKDSCVYLNRKIVFIDELAELLKTRDKNISNSLYDSLETLTRLSRAVGIHLIMGIQRPDSTVINGQIKNNVSYRICGRFVDKEPSRIMLGNDEASRLENIKGRFIVRGDNVQMIQSFYYENKFFIEPKQESNKVVWKPKTQDNVIIEPKTKSKNLQKPKEKAKIPSQDDFVDFDFSDINQE